MRGLGSSILSPLHNECDTSKYTYAGLLDSFYHMV